MNKIFDYIKNNKLEFGFVLLIFLLGVILRTIAFNHHGEIWLDELYSWYFASQDNVFLTVSKLLKEDIHMPFYFVILHFWIKLFGDSVESMRICSFLISIPIPIITFYLAKNLFNKTCAYYASIFVMVNTFCMYYSQEVRFYGLVFIFSLFAAFYFVKMLQEFNKKNIIIFVTLISLLFYTFSITPLLIASYFIIGLIYLFKNKKEEIKKFILTFFYIFLTCLPALIFTVLNAIAMKTAITYYPLDNYVFNWNIINDILENFFTLENRTILSGALNDFQSMIKFLNNPKYFICVFIPILVALFGLIKSFFSKNTKLYLFLAPSLLFVLVTIFLARYSIVALQTRYLSIVFLVIVIAFCYGLSLLKNKIVSIVIFFLFFYLNIVNLFLSQKTIFNLQRIELQSLEYAMNGYIDIKDNDYWISPMTPEKLAYYVKKGKMIPFNFSEAIVLKDKKSLKFYFGDDYKSLTRDNVKSVLMETYLNEFPYKPYEDNLKREYIDKLKKGERIIYIANYADLLISPQKLGMTKKDLENMNLVVFLYSKCIRDTKKIFDKYLKLKYVYHSDTDYKIFVYEKAD